MTRATEEGALTFFGAAAVGDPGSTEDVKARLRWHTLGATPPLPKMAKRATSDSLRTAFNDHLEETKGHVDRLEKIADMLGFKPAGKTCEAMKGLIEEGQEVIDDEGDGAVIDAALIAAAQRVEHYEIAVYGTARTFAAHLGREDAAQLLQETLDEESECDEKLTELSEDEILPATSAEGDEEGSDEDDEAAPGKSRVGGSSSGKGGTPEKKGGASTKR